MLTLNPVAVPGVGGLAGSSDPALVRDQNEGSPERERLTLGSGPHLPSSPFKPQPEASPVERYALHDLVTHDKYGLGRVVLVEGDTAVVVDFSPRKVRIMAPFARMIKL